jgi:hypothetical protein
VGIQDTQVLVTQAIAVIPQLLVTQGIVGLEVLVTQGIVGLEVLVTQGIVGLESGYSGYSGAGGSGYSGYSGAGGSGYSGYSGAGGGSAKTATIDFGSTPVYSANFSITDADVFTTSKISVTANGSTASSALGGDELECDGLLITGYCAVNGTLLLSVVTYPGPIKGKRGIMYTIG